jgi:hypothetical protein
MLVVVDHRKCAGGKLALKVETQFLSLTEWVPIAGCPGPTHNPVPPPGRPKRGDLCLAGAASDGAAFSGSSTGQSWQAAAQGLASLGLDKTGRKDKQANHREPGTTTPGQGKPAMPLLDDIARNS